VHGVELWQGKPILYDTGDFIDDYAVDQDLRNDLSALFLLHGRPPHIDHIDVVPVAISRGQVRRAQGVNREWFAKRFTSLCVEFGTDVVATNEALTIPISPSGTGTGL
jgi:poly-gamma-glutamate synthesis protein (capsule biosynthesis protein)